ncbi:EAL domain-containing protein [Marinomonas sp. A79]|uniref:cyclic-guanylate-specific phosphodiesterase n=1 Tax=Marinomonas vulgaris TaxID=2823372 RepID=A0ABS5HB94_9GAMM|nr:EAL domain-containing protein [Marinomonas vulgaris]MBR7888880.1 EAL domain-containing protein [Marinomonas vulgaris]
MVKMVSSRLQGRKKTLLLCAFFSLVSSIMVFASSLYWYLLDDLEQRTDTAQQVLDNQMQNIFVELKEVADQATFFCEKDDVKRLQKTTFYSPIFKEYGLFDHDYKLFCSNIGPIDITLYSTVIERLKSSQDRKTVSLSQSNTLSESTFFAFYQREDGLGVNGLAPPRSFSLFIDQILRPDYHYLLTIGKNTIDSRRDAHQHSASHSAAVGVLAHRSVTLDDWSLTLKVFLPTALYWQYCLLLLPFAIVSWLILLVAFYSATLLWHHYQHSLHHCIKRAIKRNEMQVHYQPIVSLQRDKPHELEALIRWHSERHGQVSPLIIVDTANRLGLMEELTWMVIRQVGNFYRDNHTVLKDIKTAVNVDRFSLLKDSFTPMLAELLNQYPELTGRLGLEVTETSALNDDELPLMVSRFEHLKKIGVSLSVDDFGTGYSGLDFLRRFPYDTLKLDQVFIASLKDDHFSRQILTSVTKLAKELGMELIAEGVERQDQLEAVQMLGVDRVQGYFFSRPLPKEQVVAWLLDNTPANTPVCR